MQLTFSQIIIPPGHTVLLKDINWSAFEEILAELGEHRAARLSYSQGQLEIMVPLAEHESDKKIIGNLVEILLEEFNLEFWALGSTTFKNEQMIQAVEPDECFYIQHEAAVRGKKRLDLTLDPPPDLAIEIDITSRTQFDNYEQLGVLELWRYDGEQLEIKVLQNGRYVTPTTSTYFPQLPLLEVIPNWVKQSQEIGRNTTMKAFREWVRNQLSQIREQDP
jgi:Uma2 family endonuclease